MLKKALSLYLLTGAIWAGFLPASFAQDVVPPPISAPVSPGVISPQTSSAVTLTLEDLPPGFTPIPPELTAELTSRLESISPQLAQAGLKPEKFFAFINPKSLEIVIGFSGMLPNQTEQASFDASLKQMQEPDLQKQIVSQLREALKTFAGIQFLDYSPIPELNNFAQASTGMSLSVLMQGKPVRMDMASFRRNAVGVFAAVMYADGQTQTVVLNDVARKLDGRILQSSAATSPTKMIR